MSEKPAPAPPPTQDGDILREQRLALHVVVANFFASHTEERHKTRVREMLGLPPESKNPESKISPRRRAIPTEAEMKEEQRVKQLYDDTKRDFDNFIQKAAEKGAGMIFDHFKKICIDSKYYDKQSAYIQKAIEVAFRYTPPRVSESPTLLSVIDGFADGDQKRNDNIFEMYEGIFDVYRYSGHLGPTAIKSRDPKIMRAAMRIFRKESKSALNPTAFQILYRPQDDPDKTNAHMVDGAIVSVNQGAHMFFLGCERDSGYPLDIIAPQSRASGHRQNTFHGLVKRKHEHGHIFVAKVMFVRSNAKALEDMTPKLGMFTTSALREIFEAEHSNMSFDTLLSILANKTGADGTSGLWL